MESSRCLTPNSCQNNVQYDFFSKKIVSKTRLRDNFVLVFLHVDTRRVYLSPSTYNPDEAWILEQAYAFQLFPKDHKLPCRILMHHNAGEFSKPLQDKQDEHNAKTQRTAIHDLRQQPVLKLRCRAMSTNSCHQVQSAQVSTQTRGA